MSLDPFDDLPPYLPAALAMSQARDSDEPTAEDMMLRRENTKAIVWSIVGLIGAVCLGVLLYGAFH